MSRNRHTYHLSRFQVQAICDAMNSQNQARIALAETMKGKPQLTSSRAIIQRRAEADAKLVASLIDGLNCASIQPADHHCIFSMA